MLLGTPERTIFTVDTTWAFTVHIFQAGTVVILTLKA